MSTSNPALAWRIFGAGIIAMSLVNLVLGSLDPTQPLPATFPALAVVSCAVSAFTLLAGAALEWRATVHRAGLVLTIYFGFVVAVLMNGRVVLAHHAVYGAYFGVAEGLALASAALIIYASNAWMERTLAGSLIRSARYAFALCALFFGGAHFVYSANTVSLVPHWLPPSQIFWADATGIFHLAAGIAILTNIQARLAVILLTVMYAAFSPLVHIPLLLGEPSKHFFWTENALNLALTGAAWTVAHSYAVRALSPHLRGASTAAG